MSIKLISIFLTKFKKNIYIFKKYFIIKFDNIIYCLIYTKNIISITNLNKILYNYKSFYNINNILNYRKINKK